MSEEITPAAATSGFGFGEATRVKSVAIVLPELLPVPPVRGGAVEHWVHEVTTRMRQPGRRLTVISRPAGVPGLTNVEYLSIPWTPAERCFLKVKDAVTWRNPLRYLAKIQNVWSYGRRMSHAVHNADLIYVHNEPNLLLFITKRRHQKIVLHMHNDHLSSRLLRPLYRRALARADAVLCVSDYIRRQAAKHYPEYANRFKAVLNATDPTVFSPLGDIAWAALESVIVRQPGKKYLLYVGRLVHIKGVHVLINAFREIHARDPETCLIVTGSSFFEGAVKTSYEKQLVSLAAPVRDSIIFTGFVPHATLKYLYAVAHVVVVPSIWQEPFGLVVLEAMASGACVIGTAVGGIPEIIEDQRTGVLVPSGDPAALATAICRQLSDPAGRSLMATAARAKVIEQYTWERLVDEVNGVFGELR